MQNFNGCKLLCKSTHHPNRLLHSRELSGQNRVWAFTKAFRSAENACLTVLRAPLGGEACFAVFFVVCFAVLLALLVACLALLVALPAACLALLAALLAAPFMTVREPLLACTSTVIHRHHRRNISAAHDYSTAVPAETITDDQGRRRSYTFSSRLGLPSLLPRKLF